MSFPIVIAGKLGLAAVITVFALREVRRPSRLLGRPFLWIMNFSHSRLTDWGLSHVQFEKRFTILDVGCGGGRTIQKLAAQAPEGKVFGVDYANGSVAASRATNAQLIKDGRVEIKHASVSQLPFPNDMFDLVTAVETQYYWPDPVNDMREILRVLKPGGKLVVIAESYKGESKKLEQTVMRLISSAQLDVNDHRRLFSTAGYAEVQVFEEQAKGWFCGVGKKPLDSPAR